MKAINTLQLDREAGFRFATTLLNDLIRLANFILVDMNGRLKEQ